MPSGLRKTSGNHFEIYYEEPWGGVASDKDPVDIGDNQFVTQQGVVEIEGTLTTLALAVTSSFVPAATGSQIALIWVQNQVIFALDQFGYIYFWNSSNQITPVLNAGTPVVASDGPWNTPTGQVASSVQVINGIAYISNYFRNTIYTFDGNVTFTVGSTYSGGQILGVLDDYLLQLNVNSSIDGVQPNRISWSGPGKFTTWDPSVDRTAGFNTLAGIEDRITGFLSLASVGLAITQKGLVELSPTGVAIGPFNFTTLWTSEVGQGSPYAATITQYGLSGFLVSNSGVYKVNTNAGFGDISGPARKAIMSTITAQGITSSTVGFNLLVSGGIFLYAYNSQFPTPYYLIATIIPALHVPGTSRILVLWLYNIATGVWQSVQYNVDDLMFAYTGGASTNGGIPISVNVTSLDQAPILSQTPKAGSKQFSSPLTVLILNIAYGAGNFTGIFVPEISPTSGGAIIPVLTLIHKQEEIKIGFTRKPTIRRVVVRAYGSGTLNFSINGVTLGSITLNGNNNVSSTYYSPFGVATVEAPQLTITSTNFNGKIVKVMLAGTFADGEID